MAGPYVVTSLVEVLRGERNALRAGTTVVLVTAVVTAALVQEVEEMRNRGYQVMVVFSGDGRPAIEPLDAPVHFVDMLVDTWQEYEPVLEH